MLPLVLVSSVLIGDPPADDLKDYQAAAAQAGRDAEAHVKLALWCESHGLKAERLKHLAIAVLTDPANATARGLMGLVAYRGKWQRPDAVAEQVKADEATAAALAEYNARRDRTTGTADAQWKLALWCEEKGLKAESTAHLATAVRLDPSHEPAWKRLGYKRHGGRWMTDDQVAAEKSEAEAQKRANRYWYPLLARWRGWLGEKTRRAEAEVAMAEVTDPRAVPAAWATFGVGTAAQQAVAVRLLGQIDSPDSSLRLASLAVFGGSIDVRRMATETLRRRDPREFVGQLVGLVHDPINYEVRPVGGPGTPGALFVEGKRLNVQRLYSPPPMPNIPLFPGEPIYYDAAGLPVVERYLGSFLHQERSRVLSWTMITRDQYLGLAPSSPEVARLIQEARNNPASQFYPDRARGPIITETRSSSTPYDKEVFIPIGEIMVEYQKAAAAAQQQLVEDVRAVEAFNASVGDTNTRVLQVLGPITGQDMGQDREAWTAWWVDQLGYAYAPPQYGPKPTLVEDVPLAYSPQPVPIATRVTPNGPTESTTTVTATNHSCFAAGTPVRVLGGPRPIEAIKVGDEILSQDVKTGALSYRPVVAIFHNRPNSTLRILLEGETVVATGIHRFWKVGRGWTMARDLKPGDAVRTLDGPVRVTAVEDDRTQPVFNLQVAEGDSFFVGQRGALVHDNSLVRPTPEPFDAPPGLASIAARAR